MINIQKVKGKNLTPKQISLMNKNRIKEFGKSAVVDFKRNEKILYSFLLKIKIK